MCVFLVHFVHVFVLTSTYHDGCLVAPWVYSREKKLGWCATEMAAILRNSNKAITDVHGLNLGLVVSLDFLRTKVLQAHASSDSGSDNVQVRRKGDGLRVTHHRKSAIIML